MSLYISSLNSGSNGNCYYVGNEHEAVLVDGGLSCRETVKRMKRLGLPPGKLKAIFVSHEHGDHTHGVPGLSKKFQLPVYITTSTMEHTNLSIREDLLHSFRAHESVAVGNLSVTAFPKFHDASDPHSFIVEGYGVTVGVFTDIGTPCQHVINHFRQCHAAFLEANYDETLLENGRYPFHLKRRIRSDHGHMSNDQALQLFLQHKPPFMSHLLLSHLSRDNNSAKIVKNLFNPNAGRTEIIVASRDRETKIFHIRNLRRPNTFPRVYQAPVQLSLF